MGGEAAGSSERSLAAAVARRHYLAGESKVEIAAALGISRFKVARLLELAHDLGMVRIQVVDDGLVDPDLSGQLREAYGLREATVVVGVPDPDRARQVLGDTAAEVLTGMITKDDVLGLPWSRSVGDLVASLTTLPRVPVVQLSGSLTIPGESRSPVDIVARAARLASGEAHVFYAPLLLDGAASAAALRRQPSVADAFAQAHRVTIAAIGIGAWTPTSSTICQALPPDDRVMLAELGVVGEAMGIVFGADGKEVPSPLRDRMITLRAEQLCAIPEVIGLARGIEKAGAVRAILASGLLTRLVVDSPLARALLTPTPS